MYSNRGCIQTPNLTDVFHPIPRVYKGRSWKEPPWKYPSPQPKISYLVINAINWSHVPYRCMYMDCIGLVVALVITEILHDTHGISWTFYISSSTAEKTLKIRNSFEQNRFWYIVQQQEAIYDNFKIWLCHTFKARDLVSLGFFTISRELRVFVSEKVSKNWLTCKWQVFWLVCLSDYMYIYTYLIYPQNRVD